MSASHTPRLYTRWRLIVSPATPIQAANVTALTEIMNAELTASPAATPTRLASKVGREGVMLGAFSVRNSR